MNVNILSSESKEVNKNLLNYKTQKNNILDPNSSNITKSKVTLSPNINTLNKIDKDISINIPNDNNISILSPLVKFKEKTETYNINIYNNNTNQNKKNNIKNENNDNIENNNENNNIKNIKKDHNNIEKKEEYVDINNLKKNLLITSSNKIIKDTISQDIKLSPDLTPNYNRSIKKHRTINSYNIKCVSDNSYLSSNKSKSSKSYEFYVNDKENNKKYNIKNNAISTTKYNFITFLPKSLLIQFMRLSNIYFLITAIIQSIKLISPLTEYTAIVPLIFVLGVSMIRELIEDLHRLKYDNKNNLEEVFIYENGLFKKSFSEKIEIGYIILIKEGSNVPADCIVIDTNLNEGLCYLETSSLDGEKNLKEKYCYKEIYGIFSNKQHFDFENFLNFDNINSNNDNNKNININFPIIEGICQCDSPNDNLYNLEGTLKLNYTKNKNSSEKKQLNFPLTINQLLLKGSIIKNTGWVIAIVVYTGSNNKIIFNSKKPPNKLSIIEKRLNKYLLGIFSFLMALCATSCYAYHHYFKQNQKFYNNFVYIENSHLIECIVIFFTYFLLLNTLIPISLIITLEIVKIIQGIFINLDVELYSKIRHAFAQAKNVSIIEELGNINYIFSDKTGTLTCNKMEFRYCIIEDKIYEYYNKNNSNDYNNINNIQNNKTEINNSDNDKKINNSNNNIINKNLISENSSSFSNEDENNLDIENFKKKKLIIFHKNYFSNLLINYFYSNKNISSIPKHNLSDNKNKRPNTMVNKNYLTNIVEEDNNEIKIDKLLYNELSNINEFWIGIVLNNQCLSEKKNNKYIFTGFSPDDIELVKTAHEQGFTLQGNNSNNKFIKIEGESKYDKNRLIKLKKKFEILHILNFTSERKRMSIIVRDKQERKIKLYCKGADSEIKKRLSNKSKNNPITYKIEKKLDFFSKKGFRTLMVGYKIISEKEYSHWNEEVKTYELKRKKNFFNKLYNKIENNLELLGATVVEDKLQEKVPETIKELRMAGIKIWVLTGDKADTAENIALSCNLISPEHKIFKILNSENEDDILNDKQILNKEFNKFINEYNEYYNKIKRENDLMDKLVKDYNSRSDKNNIKNKNENNNEINNNNNINNNSVNIYSNDNIYNNSHNILIDNSYNNFESLSNISNNNFYHKIYNIQKYNNNNNNLQINNNIINNNSNSLDSNNFYSFLEESMMNYSENNNIPPFSIIIDSKILAIILNNKYLKNKFLSISLKSSSVICCRVSPKQKSLVVKEVKKFHSNAVTLAIGDGGNDVSMILEAHVGIGIYGEEGMSAVKASDFAIGEFKHLKRLLFFHGRNNLNRISHLILYFFYKNFVFTIFQYIYGFSCLMSGQTIIDDWYITLYNLCFTALPLAIRALTDFDVLETDSNETKKLMPFLYRESHEVNPLFTLKNFFSYLLKGLIFTSICYFIIIISDINSSINKRGDDENLWYISLKIYTYLIFTVNITLIIYSNYIISYLLYTIVISSFIFYFLFLLIVHNNIIFNSCASIFDSLNSSKFYLILIIVIYIQMTTDLIYKSYKIFFTKNVANELMKVRKNESFEVNYNIKQIFITRSRFSKLFKGKISSSNINESIINFLKAIDKKNKNNKSFNFFSLKSKSHTHLFNKNINNKNKINFTNNNDLIFSFNKKRNNTINYLYNNNSVIKEVDENNENYSTIKNRTSKISIAQNNSKFFQKSTIKNNNKIKLSKLIFPQKTAFSDYHFIQLNNNINKNSKK